MRSLEINKRLIYYANYVEDKPIFDEYENETGTEVVYEDPVPYKINVSPAKGESSTRQFGDSLDYSKVLTTSDLNCPIGENAVLWIDRLDINEQYDYIVKRIADGLNTVLIAVDKVNVG